MATAERDSASPPDERPVRSLADDLRTRTDDELAELLRLRPDLLTPVPLDMTQLASRATTRPSILRALDRLDRWTLQVLDALLLAEPPLSARSAAHLLGAPAPGPGGGAGDGAGDGAGAATGDGAGSATHAADTAAALHTPAEAAPEAVEVAIRRLWLSGLVWGSRWDEDAHPYGELHVVSAVREVPAPVAAPPGTSSAGRPVADPAPEPPETAADPATAVDPEVADHRAAGAAAAFARLVERLLDRWAEQPPPVLRAGGLGVRDLRRAAADLGLDETTAAMVIEVAFAAGLLGRSRPPAADEWLPTTAYEPWTRRSVAHRWAVLADAWRTTRRVPGLVGQTDERGRARTALDGDLDRPGAPEVRAAILAALAAAPPGAAPTPDGVHAVLNWRRPRVWGEHIRPLEEWTLREAATLGVTGAGAIASYARPLAPGGGPGIAEVATDRMKALATGLGPFLPAEIETVVIQADLTAVAAGPLARDRSRELGLLADVESAGTATVYRFSPDSVRRAFDAGRSAADVHAFLARVSATPVPQPLTYLVDDIARRHGVLRVGRATAILVCEDPALLDQLLADRRTGGLLLHRVAPTVLTAGVEAEYALARLRELGYSPGVTGEAAPDLAAPAPRPRPEPPAASGVHTPARGPARPGRAPDPALLAAAVRAVRAGDRVAAARPRDAGARGGGPAGPAGPAGPRSGSASGAAPGAAPGAGATGGAGGMGVVPLLHRAAQDGTTVRITYADPQGSRRERLVEPISVAGGWLTAYDHRADAVRTFALHRIGRVTPVE